jgi:hypothetical protein
VVMWMGSTTFTFHGSAQERRVGLGYGMIDPP